MASHRELDYREAHFSVSAEGIEETEGKGGFSGLIGQKRALDALKMGTEIRAKGYNIFVTGLPGTGRNTAIRMVLDGYRPKGRASRDICFVYNFEDPDSPRVLYFPPGKGVQFKKEVHDLIETVKVLVRSRFGLESFLDKREEVLRSLKSFAQK